MCTDVEVAMRAPQPDPERTSPAYTREGRYEDRRIFEMTCASVWEEERQRGSRWPGPPVHLWVPEESCPHVVRIGTYREPDRDDVTRPCRSPSHDNLIRYNHHFDSWAEAEAWLLEGCEAGP